MKIISKYVSSSSSYETISDSLISGECSFCNTFVNFAVLGDFYRNAEYTDSAFAVVRCPSCNMISAAACNYDGNANLEFSEIYPPATFTSNFSQEIKEISPRFIEIYEQSLTAKNVKLDDLVGIGLRKSVEFLIAGYIEKVIGETPNPNLRRAIDQLKAEDAIVTATIIRIVGNDETHFIKKYDMFGIDDMLKGIDYLVQWMQQKYFILKNKDFVESLLKPNK